MSCFVVVEQELDEKLKLKVIHYLIMVHCVGQGFGVIEIECPVYAHHQERSLAS
jgi:hypothetical protein